MANVDPLVNVILRNVRARALEENNNFPISQNSRTFDYEGTVSSGPLYSGTGSRRITSVLDAIASICVSQAKSQIVATSLTFNKDEETVKLCVAQSDDSEASNLTADFLEDLWNDSKTLSMQEKTARGDWSTADVDSPSPTYSDDVIITVRKVFEKCYGHCHLKLKQKIMKRWDDFVKFRESWGKTTSGPERLRNDFDRLSRGLRDAVRLIVSGQTRSEAGIWSLTRDMGGVWHQFKGVTGGTVQLRLWVDEYKQETGIEFPLYRFLKKCYSLYATIQTLCSFAMSSRLYPVFSKKLVIVCVDPELVQLELPGDHQEWRSYLGTAFDVAGIDPEDNLDSLEREIDLALDPHFTRGLARVPVHCECLLLAYHHRRLYSGPVAQREAETPPLNYIGCSKSSCYSCTRYFRAYNSSSANSGRYLHFLIRGSHSKVHPWGMPSLQDQDADFRTRESFFGQVCEDYGMYLAKTGQVKRRAGSDSTVQRMRSVEDTVGDAFASLTETEVMSEWSAI